MLKPLSRKSKRLEKLLTTGILLGFQQRVKASFEYLDSDGHGYFTLKVRFFNFYFHYFNYYYFFRI